MELPALLCALLHQWDCTCLQETWASPGEGILAPLLGEVGTAHPNACFLDRVLRGFGLT